MNVNTTIIEIISKVIGEILNQGYLPKINMTEILTAFSENFNLSSEEGYYVIDCFYNLIDYFYS